MAKLPDGFEVESQPIPEGFEVESPGNDRGRFVPEPFAPNENIRAGANIPGITNPRPVDERAGVNPLEGNFRELGQGVALGFGDEIEAAMAAVTAKYIAPMIDEDFLSDQSISQIYADAVKDIRAKRRQFREQEGAIANVPTVIGGLMTGGSGINRLATSKAHPFLAAGAVGAVEGGIGGAGVADADEFFSLDTLKGSMIGATVGAVGGFVFPMIQGLVNRGAQALPQAAKSLFTTKSALKRRYIAQLESGEGLDDDMAKYILDGAGKLRNNNLLPEMVTQGWHPGTANMVAGSKPADRAAFKQMLKLVEKGRKNRSFAKSPANHPRRIVGDSFLKRMTHIKSANKEASEEIGRIARDELKGSRIDLSDASSDFADAIEANGIEFGVRDNGRFFVDFENSSLTPKDRAPVKEVLRQMYRLSRGGVDAADAHDLKRIIDNNVTWGKGDSMSHDAAEMLKGFRRGIDDTLDETFPNYAAANTKYKDTIEVLESMVDAMGKRIDLDNPRVDQSLGRELRKVFGNTKVAENMVDLIDEAEDVAVRYGGEFDDNVMAQLHFFDDLSERLGPFEGTSFRAEVGRGNVDALRKVATGDRTITGQIFDAGDQIIDAARNISDDGALDVMKRLVDNVDNLQGQ